MRKLDFLKFNKSNSSISVTMTIFCLILGISGDLFSYTIEELAKNTDQIKDIVSIMLQDGGYQINNNNNFEIQLKPKLIIIIVDTTVGKKFLKLHNKPKGSQEFEGAKILANYFLIIKPEHIIEKEDLELVVQPYLESVIKKGLLFDTVENMGEESNLLLIQSMFSKVLGVSSQTLEYSVKPAPNDLLYFERLKNKALDNVQGRIEAFYYTNHITLDDMTFTWDEILDKKWTVDGILYQESLRELLYNARQVLDPYQKRLIALCHGDWHDLNVHITANQKFVFFDCELSGRNDVLGDAIVYLVFNAIQGDYLVPKYYQSLLNHQTNINSSSKKFLTKQRKIRAVSTNDMIYLDGIGTFGCSGIRKKITHLFLEEYLIPLISYAQIKFKIDFNKIEDTIKACILMRLLAVYNVSFMEPMDQAKIFGLIFKIIATPSNANKVSSIIERFEIAL